LTTRTTWPGRRVRGRRVYAALAALLLTAARPLSAQELPAEVQTALLKKTFLFAPSLGGAPTVLVVFADASEEQPAQRIVNAFRALEVPADAVHADAAAARVQGVGAVYFLGPAVDDGLRRLCVEHQRLSVAGTVALAESGRVAIAVGVARAGSPEIVVHRARLAAEGHRLEPRLLKLARVVG
jgi:hypothetical protein